LTVSLKGSSHLGGRFRGVKNRFRDTSLILDGQAYDLGLRNGSRSGLLRSGNDKIADRSSLNFSGAAYDREGIGCDSGFDTGGTMELLGHNDSCRPLRLIRVYVFPTYTSNDVRTDCSCMKKVNEERGRTVTRTIEQIENRKITKAERDRLRRVAALPDSRIDTSDIPEVADRAGWVRVHENPEHPLHRALSRLLADRS
jgi:hypothetical protein